MALVVYTQSELIALTFHIPLPFTPPPPAPARSQNEEPSKGTSKRRRSFRSSKVQDSYSDFEASKLQKFTKKDEPKRSSIVAWPDGRCPRHRVDGRPCGTSAPAPSFLLIAGLRPKVLGVEPASQMLNQRLQVTFHFPVLPHHNE